MPSETEIVPVAESAPLTKAEIAALAAKAAEAREQYERAFDLLHKCQSRMKRYFHAWEKASERAKRANFRLAEADMIFESAKRAAKR